MNSQKKILIIDFMFLWNRIYSVKGAATGEHIFRSLQHVDQSSYYYKKYAVLDGRHSTGYRKKLLSEYKSNRSDKSEVYKYLDNFLGKYAVQLKTVKFIKNDHYEADDVISALVQRFDQAVKYIYSGDTDLYQLLKFDNTYIGTKYSRGMIIEPISESSAKETYHKRYNLKVEDVHYIVKCKTFKGDTSDNIPIACPGMRTATIDYLIEHFWKDDEPLTSKILLDMATYLREHGKRAEFENFYDNRKAIIRNYKLVQLGYDTPDVFSNAKILQENGNWE